MNSGAMLRRVISDGCCIKGSAIHRRKNSAMVDSSKRRLLESRLDIFTKWKPCQTSSALVEANILIKLQKKHTLRLCTKESTMYVKPKRANRMKT